MQLLVVRHARAVRRGTRGVAEEDRPLTKDGTAEFSLAARGLARLVPPPDLALTSPLLRARQTAEIAVAAWQVDVRLIEERALVDPTPERLLRRLARRTRTASVALFGHEPGVSALLAHLLGVPAMESLAFKKGGAALVETARPMQAGSGQLIWFVSPAILRLVGGRR